MADRNVIPPGTLVDFHSEEGRVILCLGEVELAFSDSATLLRLATQADTARDSLKMATRPPMITSG